MSLPLHLLVSGKRRDNGQVLIAAVEKRIIFGRPDKAVDWLSALYNLRTKHAAATPSLDLAIFTCSCQSAFVAPLDADDGGLMSL